MDVLSKTFRFDSFLPYRSPTTPPMPCDINGLGSCAFARHYLRNHYYFLLLWVLRCFSSPRLPSLRNDRPSTCRVAPFGYSGINGYLLLPRTFRSLSRPSSPPRAKASTVCPFLLSSSSRTDSTSPYYDDYPGTRVDSFLSLLYFFYYLNLHFSNMSKILYQPPKGPARGE